MAEIVVWEKQIISTGVEPPPEPPPDEEKKFPWAPVVIGAGALIATIGLLAPTKKR